jgi:hypothetical protein
MQRNLEPYKYKLKPLLLQYAATNGIGEIRAKLMLADYIQVHHCTVSRWCNLRLSDPAKIKHATLVAIASFFACNVDDLLAI